jgi:hypothetical protein
MELFYSEAGDDWYGKEVKKETKVPEIIETHRFDREEIRCKK